MSNHKFSILQRIKQLGKNLSKENLLSRQFLTNLIGWFLSLILFGLIISVSGHKIWQLFLFIHVIFLIYLLRDLYKKLKPPIEILLLLLYLILLMINGFIRYFIKSEAILQNPGAFLVFLQILITGGLVLIFSYIIVHNSYGKRISLLWYSLLMILGYYVISNGNEHLLFLFHVLLVVVLLQKTRWLEELSKVECWIYILFLYFFFKTVSNWNPFAHFSTTALTQANFWYILTSFFYLLFKYYILAMLIRIPIVLVYNHASLSRKLKISGLFQSTFPQFIQFILLLLIFYSFLSGWQAENLRNSIQEQLTQIERGRADPSLKSYKLNVTSGDFSEIEADYEMPESIENLSGIGILSLRQKNPASAEDRRTDYFIFSKKLKADRYAFLVKVDSLLLKSLAQNLQYLAGTSMVAYPLKPGKWTSYIYDADFIWHRDRDIRIFPLGAIPQKVASPAKIRMEAQKRTEVTFWSKFSFLAKSKREIVFGRVYIPLRKTATTTDNYLAFDILLNLGSAILFSGLAEIIIVLLFVYLLLNSIVVRQVVRFGSQINQTIIQKFGQLKKGIQQISSGNLDFKIKLEGEDEFVELANHFNQMGDQLKQTIEEVREKERLAYELQLAREVQLSLLPQSLPQIPGFQIAASMRTANTVGGDFYDIFPLDKNRYLFTIGDVSGKGSSAALYMAQCMSLVRFSRQFSTDIGEVSSRLNSYFASSITDRQIFVTAIIGILDTKSNTLQYIRAGHTEPIFIPGDLEKEIQVIKSNGIGIGLTRSARMFEKNIKPVKFSLKEGDTLFFYTDGVIEAARPTVEAEQPDMELYGEDRLQELLEKVREKGATEILQTIEQDVDSFYAGSIRVDDHSVFIIQRAAEN